MDNLNERLKVLVDQIGAMYYQQLEDDGKVASGLLLNSISTEFTFLGERFIVTLNLADHWKYVEENCRPHWPPVDPIERWVRIKRLPLLPTARGIPLSLEQLVYLVRKKIAEKGTTGSKSLQKTLDSPEVDSIKNEIMDVFVQYYTDMMYESFNKILI